MPQQKGSGGGNGRGPGVRCGFGKRPELLKKTLEEDIQAKQKQIKTLAKQNALLRAKQSIQLDLLRDYEGSLHHMGVLLCQLAERSDSAASNDMAVLAAAMVDLQALALLQQLHGGADSPTEQPCCTTGNEIGSGNGSGNSNSTGSDSADCTNAALSSQGGAAGLMSRTQRNLSAITPEAVLAMRGISAQQLAAEIKTATMRIALMMTCQCHSKPTIADSLEEAVESLGILVMLGMIAADQQYLEVTCMNLDSMKQEAPPGDLWAHVVTEAHLKPQQRVQICLAFQCYIDQRAPLLCRQQEIMQQLQGLLGSEEQHTLSTAGICSDLNPWNWSAPAAAEGGSGTGADSKPDCTSTSSNSNSPSSGGTRDSLWNFPTPLEITEQAEQLLQQLQRIVSLQREASRRLVYLWINLLSVEQHADAWLASYPFIPKVPAVCAHIWEEDKVKLGICQL